MNRKRKYNDEQFREAVRTSISIREALGKLGLVPAGGNYKHFRQLVNSLGCSTKHFLGKGYLKNKTHNWTIKIPMKDILIENSTYTSSNGLRKRLIGEGIFDAKCSSCNLTHWLGQPISLELDHINGINTDNRVSNLRILCPNCHAQTSNYRGKNKKSN